MEGSPLQPRPPQGRHRAARLRPEGSAGRVQEGELRALHGDEGSDRGGDRPVPVAAHAGHRRGRRGALRRRSAQPAPRRPPQLTLSGPSTTAARRRSAPSAAAEAGERRRRAAAPAPRAPAATTRSAGQARRAESRPQRSRAPAAAARNTRSATELDVQRATCDVRRAREQQGQQRRLLPFCFEG